MNWGGFAGGFSHGFNSGVSMGKTVSEAIKQKKLDDVRAQGIAEATAARDQAAAASVTENGIATPATAATPPTDINSTPAPAPAAATPPPVDSTLAGDPMTADQPQPAAPAPAAPQAASAPAEPPAAATTASPAAAGMPMAKKPFSVGDKGFDTREEALAHAQKNAPPLMDYMTKTMVPKMQEALVAQGDIEKAEAWGKWAKDKDNERHMATWAKAKTAFDNGDIEGSVKHLNALHKDYDDGLTVVSQEAVKDKAGTLTGYNMKIKSDATGETRVQFVDPQTLVNMGLQTLSPIEMFNKSYATQTAASALAAKARIDAQNDERTAKRQEAADVRKDARQEQIDIRREGREGRIADRQHGYKLEELTTAEQLKEAGVTSGEKAKLQAKIDLARQNGATPEDIKTMIPHLIGAGEYKKTTDPTERRALVAADLVKNDPSFARADATAQNKKVDQMMSVIYGAPAAKAAPASPAAAAPGKGKGTPYLKPDGTVIYR
jgi:hypothetical protein